MSADGLIINNHCCVNTHAHEAGIQQYKKLVAYFESHKEIKDFPSIILSENLPTQEELFGWLHSERSITGKKQSVILAVRDRNVRASAKTWQLLETGIDDVIAWDDEEELILYLQAIYDRRKTVNQIIESPLVKDNLIGQSTVWNKFIYTIIEYTLFSTASILLIGESRTGKELVARLIHTIDPRKDKKKLVIVDCTTIVPELSGSELFGHERGSYTNAIQSRDGAFALANEGTLFLDEVGELSLNLQAELLRVLQEGTFKKVGSNTWQKTSFRLVCATNKNLHKAVEEGKFRQDLYFRIADAECIVPSLRDRKDDIELLVNHFISKIFSGSECPEVDKPVLDYLVQRTYPGNVRELKQLVQRIAMKHVRHKKITVGEVPENDRINYTTDAPANNTHGIEALIRKALLSGEDWWNLKDKLSETAIQVALELENNNKEKAAERLGVNVRTVQQYVKKSSA
jgi:transcriptional regulator with GAF, ATPase, and Fis domain